MPPPRHRVAVLALPVVLPFELGIPARASRLAAWHQLVRQAPPAVLAGALGVSPDTATRHALLAGADWATYASRRSSPATPEYEALPVERDHHACGPCPGRLTVALCSPPPAGEDHRVAVVVGDVDDPGSRVDRGIEGQPARGGGGQHVVGPPADHQQEAASDAQW